MATAGGDTRAAWEREVTVRHRWGQHGEDRAREELARLRKLREAAGTLDADAEAVLEQIAGPEICNWRLEEMVLAVCEAIGLGRPAPHGTGHLATITAARWARVWAYYVACRDWLASERRGRGGWEAILGQCDPGGEVRRHVAELLGEPTELKALYVRRFCLCLEYWLDGCPQGERPEPSPEVARIEEEIRRLGGDEGILGAFRFEGTGRLEVCHHKLFRRYDIILSSIGAGRWRGAMPVRGTDGIDRADELEPLLVAIEAWARGAPPAPGDDPASHIPKLLGDPTPTKIFQAELLASLLRSQQLSARRRGEKRRSATPS